MGNMNLIMKKCESCLAGFSKEDVRGNCTCDDMTNPDIEKKVEEFEKRFGGFIATQSKREKQDKDNDWLCQALTEMYEMGQEVKISKEIMYKSGQNVGKRQGAADMKKRIIEAIENERLMDNTEEPEDIAYNSAITDALDAAQEA